MKAADIARAERAYGRFRRAGDDKAEMRAILHFLPEDMPKREKKARTWVKTFIPIMAPKVEAKTKQQTVRPWPKRPQDIPKHRDRISCREWTGRPYNSKQRVLCEGEIAEVLYIEIRAGSIVFPGVRKILEPALMLEFAKADGFDSLQDFHAWFLKKRTMFAGIFIKWRPD